MQLLATVMARSQSTQSAVGIPMTTGIPVNSTTTTRATTSTRFMSSSRLTVRQPFHIRREARRGDWELPGTAPLLPQLSYSAGWLLVGGATELSGQRGRSHTPVSVVPYVRVQKHTRPSEAQRD